MEYQTEAILLAVRNWGDADRMVTLFSREYGKITAIAYGARRSKSKLGGCLQPFSHLDLSLSFAKLKRGLDSVKQCEIMTSFRELREDLTLLAYGNFLAELVSELWPEREKDFNAFYILLHAYHLLLVRNPRITTLAAAWQLLSLAGFQPSFDRCLYCEKDLIFPAFIDVRAGGVVCPHCDHYQLPEITRQVRDLIGNLIRLDWNNPGNFSINGKVLNQAESILCSFLRFQLDKDLNSLKFIQQINAM
ncbi:DNA repair protein RecO [Methylomusa anaerophila]|uniref:DNA repair protein RecO n=1 Tax=Methylomusa anaerophila TaxID=1930071 RepID=A0A348AP01_9FIRM|nr:DNA repair protein RecO [Methylomusa anaerophila]